VLVRIVFSVHAVERMQRRKVSVSEVERIIADPDGRIRQSMEKYIYFKMLPGRSDNSIAAVVVEQFADRLEVITIMNNFEARG
jgi:hypothetical protein